MQGPARRLAAYGAATIYEASGREGMLDPSIKPVWHGARVCGPACCVHSPVGDNLALHRALTTIAPGEVLVVASGQDLTHGAWGEVMTEAALARSVLGIVTDGAVRDSTEIERLGFPAFAAGIAVGGCDKTDPGSVGGTITIGGVVVRSGDVIVGDADGVVVVAADRVDLVAKAAGLREVREREIIRELRAGKTTCELLGLDAS